MQTQLFIDGRFVPAASGRRFESIDPASEETLGEASAGGPQDVARAVDASLRAFEGGWRSTTGRERAGFLRGIAASITADREELARLEVMDNGKPLPEALWDIDDAAGCFDYYADLADGLDGREEEDVPLPDARFDCRVRREPVGPCGQIIPWNYPLLMAAWKVAPALAAGCTMVLKPSEFTPFTAIRLAEIARNVGLPNGVLNVVTGFGAEAGAPIASAAGLRKVAFTGSVPTGRRIMQAAAESIKAVSLELGGKSPLLVFDDADVEHAVAWIMFGIFWNQGQVCSATSRLLVQRGIAPRLFDRLAEAARGIRIGNGLDAGVKLGPLVSRGQYEKVLGLVGRGRTDATLLTGGARPRGLEKGYFIEPTVFVDVPEASELWKEEIFGPVLAARTFDDEAEALRLANDTRFGLAAAVLSADEERADRVARGLDAGIVWINCSQPTFTQAPWGGRKQSGIGRELGQWGLDNYLDVKQMTRYRSSQVWDWYA